VNSKPRTQNYESTVAIIGAGRLGTALGLALNKIGYEITAVVSKRVGHAKESAKLIGSTVQPLSSKQLSQLPVSDIVFIATPDGDIEKVANELALKFSTSDEPEYIFHTSGALSSEVLRVLRNGKIAVGSFHPLISVSDSVIGAESLGKAYYCIEGDNKAVKLGKKIAGDLGGESFSIKTKDKAFYHASAVVACGHLVALFDIAVEMLRDCGLNSDEARKALLPLVESTVENLYVSEPAKALTGTFARADVITVRKHLEVFERKKLDAALAAYILLGKHSLELARQNGKDEKALKEIEKLLSGK